MLFIVGPLEVTPASYQLASISPAPYASGARGALSKRYSCSALELRGFILLFVFFAHLVREALDLQETSYLKLERFYFVVLA